MKKILSIIAICLLSLLTANNISGVSFFQYSMDEIGTDNETQGFELNRVYLTYKNKISDKVSYKFQADMQNDGAAYYMYIKNAKVDLLCGTNTKLTIGLQGMNMFSIQEKTWGNRFTSKSAMDEHEWSSSADLGFGLSQSFNNFSASLLFTNGEGYKSASLDNNAKISIQAVYGEKSLNNNDGFNVGGVFSTLTYDDQIMQPDILPGGTGTIVGIFSGFSRLGLRLGFDYNMGNNLDLSDYGDKSSLLSIYGNYSLSFIERLSLFGRFDSIEDSDDASQTNNTTIFAGLIYKCTDGILVSPNFYTTTNDTDNSSQINLTFQCKF